ncbi:HNH endonuclease [Streptomyces adonidis]|uniref:HNH endonuclease n=1 Tax=Streptomyces adonidis TaxID=3231367 RepID=UPI0034DB783A
MSVAHAFNRHLSAPRRRARKQQLATRFGLRCAYCRRPFRTLREATLDHIVPASLYRSWSVTSLVLACRPCNDAKSDQLPLSMALLLLPSTGGLTGVEARLTPVDLPPGDVDAGSTPVDPSVDAGHEHPPVHVNTPVFTDTPDVFTDAHDALTSTPVVLMQPAASDQATGSGQPVNTEPVHAAPVVFTLAHWRLLARLAHAHHPLFTATWSADPDDDRSPPTQRESTPHHPDRHPTGRPDYPRAPRSIRACVRPSTGVVTA